MDVLVQAIVIAVLTALATGYISGRIIETKVNALEERLRRIENFLNGLLTAHGLKDREGNG